MNDQIEPYARWSASPQYIIARPENGSFELLCISLEAGEKALPVFSLQELAYTFLRYRALEPEWHVRESHNEEIISLLLGSCADVERILPNPLPDPLAAQDALLNSIDRETFMESLLG